MNQTYEEFIKQSRLDGLDQAQLMKKRGFNITTFSDLRFVRADEERTRTDHRQLAARGNLQ